MPGFELTRGGKALGRLLFDWRDAEYWTTRDVRLEAFTDRQLERQVRRILERNEPRLRVAGRVAEDIGRTLEGLREVLWYASNGRTLFEYSELEDEPARKVDRLADT